MIIKISSNSSTMAITDRVYKVTFPLALSYGSSSSCSLLFADKKGKASWICIAPHCEKLASEALRDGSHSFRLQLHHTCLGIYNNRLDQNKTLVKLPGCYNKNKINQTINQSKNTFI